MFKRKASKDIQIDTLIGAQTRIHGDVEFAGGLHLDGRINGDVKGALEGHAILSVSESGCIEGSVFAASVLVNGTVHGDIDATDRVELGAKARVLGSVHYSVIETAVGAQIYGKLNHRAPGEITAAGSSTPAEAAPGAPAATAPNAAVAAGGTPVGRGTPEGESKP
jgi:cytoskeletal protein CcmA (bactofilin family)